MPVVARQCPRCLSIVIYRSRRSRAAERLLKLFFVFPYRCRECGSRFYRLRLPFAKALSRLESQSAWTKLLNHIFGLLR